MSNVVMTMADIAAEKRAMDRFHAELDALMAELGYDADEERRELDRLVGMVLV